MAWDPPLCDLPTELSEHDESVLLMQDEPNCAGYASCIRKFHTQTGLKLPGCSASTTPTVDFENSARLYRKPVCCVCGLMGGMRLVVVNAYVMKQARDSGSLCEHLDKGDRDMSFIITAGIYDEGEEC